MFSAKPLGALAAAVALCSLAISAAERESPVQQEVLRVDAECAEALVSSDAAALERILSEDVTFVTAAGRIEDKRSIVYGAKSGHTKYDAIVATERKARVEGESAVVTGVAAMRGVARKVPFETTARYTAVYARRDGRWQLVAYQATPLPVDGRVIGGEPA